MKKLKIVPILTILFIISSCSTMKASFTREGRLFKIGEDHYLTGDYISAVTFLSRSLQIDPYYEEAMMLLDESYSNSIKQLDLIETELSNSNRKFINHEYLTLYTKVMEMYDEYNNVPDNYNKTYEYHEKVTIYREKAALDYYNAAIEESSLHNLESEKRCFDYLKLACEIWGDEYLDSYSVAAEYIYNKANRIVEAGTRESYIEASGELGRIDEWVEGYKDSSTLIDLFIEKSKVYYIVTGDIIISEKLEEGILKSIKDDNRKLSIYPAGNKNAAKYQLENNPENLLGTSNEFRISNIVRTTVDNIEYIDPYKEAQFVVERKMFWIDELGQPVREVHKELLETWEDDEDYRIRLLENEAIVGYKEFNFTYILNKIHSSIKITATIEVYSASLDRIIGKESRDFTYIDTVDWISSKKGHPDVFRQVLTDDVGQRPVYSYDKLLIAVKENANLKELSEKGAVLLIEDNPLSKKID